MRRRYKLPINYPEKNDALGDSIPIEDIWTLCSLDSERRQMVRHRLAGVLEQLRCEAAQSHRLSRSDGQLLELFTQDRDAGAFKILMRRHGAMVMSVCRRIVGDHHDAEDAFQAAFLVLARKAGVVMPREQLGNWLYGVAYRTALEVRGRRQRTKAREKQVVDMPHTAVSQRLIIDDVQPAIDEELSRLPDKYRSAIVLCDMEGRSRKEAARQLRVPEGTLSSRLTTGRRMLAGRLSGRGIGLSAGFIAAYLGEQVASASVAPALLTTTVRAAVCLATGAEGAAALVSDQVLTLTQGVIQRMFLSKLKTVAVVTLAFVICLGGGFGLFKALSPSLDASALAVPVTEKKSSASEDKSSGSKSSASGSESPKGSDDKKLDASTPFSGIDLQMGKAVIKQTGKNALEVKADPIFLDKIVSGVDKDTLKLHGVVPGTEFNVEVKEIGEIKVGSIGKCELKDVKAKKLVVRIDAAAEITISGAVDELEIHVEGVAHVHAGACKAKVVTVHLNGAGHAVVQATEKLQGDVNGVAGVEYIGSPTVEVAKNGVGTVQQKKVEDKGPESG